MIQIQTQHVHFTESEDAFGLMEAVVNQMIDGVARVLEKEIQGVKCSTHPNQNSIFEVTGNHPNAQDLVSMRMVKWCCQDFKDSVKLTVK